MSTKPIIKIDITVPENINQSESIKEEKTGSFSIKIAGRKRTAFEAFGNESTKEDNEVGFQK